MSLTLKLPENASEAAASKLIPLLGVTIKCDETRRNVLHVCCNPEEENEMIAKLHTIGVPADMIERA